MNRMAAGRAQGPPRETRTQGSQAAAGSRMSAGTRGQSMKMQQILFIGGPGEPKRGLTNDSAAGWADRPPSNTSDAGGSSGSGLTHVRGNAGTKKENATNFVYRRAGITQKRVNERLGGGVGRPTAE